jgi:two-component system, chemotaxis family, response regulator Rcp1
LNAIIGRKAEILLVEDSLSDIKLIQEGLKDTSFEHNLHVTTDGASAMDFLLHEGKYEEEETVIDLVILDLNLPKKNGREVLAEIKSSDILRRTPVIILSSSEAESDVLDTYDHHANCYFVKPINLDEFMDTIRLIEEFWIQRACLPSQA